MKRDRFDGRHRIGQIIRVGARKVLRQRTPGGRREGHATPDVPKSGDNSRLRNVNMRMVVLCQRNPAEPVILELQRAELRERPPCGALEMGKKRR